MLLRIDGQEVWVGLVGRFNAYNLLAVYGAAALLGSTAAKRCARRACCTP